ncbi:MAG: non-canonical purine NTP pyrophosphatase, partial [Opitutaceae bacterium]
CVLFVITAAGREFVAEGRVEGRLLRSPRGGSGFGYDPLFVPTGYDRTYAELTEDEKNQISHRGRAWLALVSKLKLA